MMKKIVLEEIEFEKKPVDEFLVEYNHFLAEIYKKNFSDIRFRSSPIFNKHEAQSHFYQRLLLYSLGVETLKDSEVTLEVRDPVIGNALKSVYGNRVQTPGRDYNFKLFIKRYSFYLAMTVFFKTISFFKKGVGHDYDAVIRTYFVPRSINKDGELREEYLSAFADDLFSNKKTLCVYKILDWHDWKKFWKATDTKKFDFCLYEHLLSPLDIISVFSRFLFSKITLNERVSYRNVDISPLLLEALDEEYSKIGALINYTEEVVAKKIFGFKPEAIYFPYENQAWEKVYQHQKSKNSSKALIVGFQHTGVSFKLLNYFPSVVEKTLPIYPDVIFTVGDIIKKVLEEKAFYSSKIITAGAIRHSHFVVDGSIKSLGPKAQTNKIVTYAFSYDFSLYHKILTDLGEVFDGTDIKVYLKFHPLFSDAYLKRHFGHFFNKNLILGTPITWAEIYDTADIILYDDNTIGFEGMIKGVKTYLYKDAEKFYDCKRDYYFDVWRHEVGKSDLYEMRDLLISGSYPKGFDQSKLDDYLLQYFRPYVAKKTYGDITQSLKL